MARRRNTKHEGELVKVEKRGVETLMLVSSDGDLLASGGEDSRAQVYPASMPAFLDIAERSVGYPVESSVLRVLACRPFPVLSSIYQSLSRVEEI